MRTEKELDYLEMLIPSLAESATKKAYLVSLGQGVSFTVIDNEKLVTIALDGTKTILEDAKPMVKIR